ncbi:MAG TPA: metalloregulator ArsR/SmtB family transcription factor, partial [Phycisphaerae bacterium]|nr:metalloregulator ArsR/SmtB family transcription factor [Phycisphaerae bacterium]
QNPMRLHDPQVLTGRIAEIAEHLGIPSNAASQHLGIMKAHGILGSERDGKTVYYRITSPQPAWLLDCIRNHSPE